MTLSQIYEQLDSAKETERESRRVAVYNALLRDLRKISKSPTATSSLEQAASEYVEFKQGIARYLTQTTKRDKDLVLDTLIEAAQKRFHDVLLQFQYARNSEFSIVEESALKFALNARFAYAVPQKGAR